MSPTVELDADIFEYLKSQAEPLVDTPSSVLRRLLDMDDSASTPTVILEDEHEGVEPRGTPVAARAKRRSAVRKSPGGRTRAPSGTLLPEQQYEKPLLRALVAAGGEAPYREVLDAVREELKDALMPADFETLASGSVRWHSRLQFVRLRLIERGEMDRDAPRGIWRITDAGRHAVEVDQS